MATKRSHESKIQDRRSDRFDLRGQCQIIRGEDKFGAHIINVASNGALIAVLEEHNLKIDEGISVFVSEEEDLSGVTLLSRVVHGLDHYIGVAFSDETEQDRARIERFFKMAGFEMTSDGTFKKV